jgi:predicted peroxiredoxin
VGLRAALRPGCNILKPVARKVGLVISSAPSQGNSCRDQLDIALAAASLGLELELFFTARGIDQLIGNRGGHQGWKVLPELSNTRAWASTDTIDTALNAGQTMCLPVKAALPSEVADMLAACDSSMAI